MTYKLESNFTIEDLGIQEEWVYDIEVEDNHNFFGNDILVHNSQYVSLEKIIKKKYPDGADRMEIVEFIDKYMDKKAQVLARDRLDNWYSYTMNSYLPEKLQLDREIISDCLPFETKVETQYGPRDIGLVAKNPEQYLVISTDKDGNKSYKKVINSKKSKHKRKLIKLIFPDGKELVCTPNHEVAYLENGQIKYKRAIEITETDDVFIEG